MSDGLTITILGLLIVLSGIGVGVYFWINRPQAATHDEDFPRIQPLFGSEQAHALDHVGEEPFVSAEPVEPGRRTPAGSPVVAAHTAHPASAASAQSAAPVSYARPMSPAVVPVGSTVPASNGGGAAPRHDASHAGLPVSAAPGRAPVVTPRAAPLVSPVAAAAATAGTSAVAGNTGVARGVAPAAAPARGEAAGTAIRFSIPTDGTLQFLPGRLEVMGGSERGREIRFVRQPSFEAPTVTFGRSEGEPYRHVQLVDPTVSRQHARLRLSEAGWMLTNLSTTNPVAHNGAVMTEHAEVLLADGDRIEMGEVVFRFRAR